MSDEEKIRARCEAHDMAYDPAVHTGCILCRRGESEAEESAAKKKQVGPYVVAVALTAIALGGIGLGIYGHQKQRTASDADETMETREDAPGESRVEEAEAQLMLGRSGVDQYGYPNDAPDKLTLLQWLRTGRYKKLTASLESLEDEADADFHKEHWPSVAFATFQVPERRLGRRLDGWVKATPRSFAPYLARAQQRVALARYLEAQKPARPATRKRRAKIDKLRALATADVDRALELRPDAVDVHMLRLAIATDRGADIATRTQIIDAALEHCVHCVGPRAAYLRAITPRLGGSHDLMKKKAGEWQYTSENPKLRQLLGYADADLCEALAAEDPERALTHCGRALRSGANAGFLSEKARVLIALERVDEATSAFSEALAIAPQDARTLSDRGRALLALERFDDAAADFALALRLDATDARSKASLNEILEKQVRAAYYQAEAGEIDDAIANYDRVLAMNPRYADALAFRGMAYAKKGDLESAERDLLRAIKVDPRSLEAYQGLDGVLFRQDRLDEIIAHWNRYLKRRPKDATALFKRSGAHYHKGQMELAMRDVRTACQLGNDEACAMQHRFSATP